MKYGKGSLILTIMGSLGVIGTSVLAVKATPAADAKIKGDSRENHDGDPYAYSTKEAVESAWKFYIPAATVGALSIACVIGANMLNRKQQASLASAYAMAAEGYKKYQNAAKKVFGEEGHRKIVEQMHIEKAEHRVIQDSGVFGPGSTLSIDDSDVHDSARTFYEPYSDRYFESTIAKVIEAEYHLNRNMCLGMSVSLNDFFDFLGISGVNGGNDIGWCCCDDYYWIDFDHSVNRLDDGMEVISIDMVYSPTSDF